MNTTPRDRYLEVPPWEAFIMMVNDQYQFELNPDTTTLVELESLTDDRVEVTIATRRSRSLRNLLPPVDQFTFVFTRLNIGEYFGGEIMIPSGALTELSTVTIVGWIQDNNNSVVFDKNDIIHEEIPGTSPLIYTLQTHPRSLRWVGNLIVNIA